MRILLPPSEGKRPGGAGRPRGERTRPDPLEQPRRAVIEALLRYPSVTEAAKALLLPASVIDESLAANEAVLTSKTMPAIERYAGVVYEGLSVTTLSPAARTTADDAVLIFSGLFGVLRGRDAVPLYRVPAKAALPGLGIASTFWKPHLVDAMPRLLGRGPIIDLRSTDYGAMWSPARDNNAAARLITVRVLSTKPDGSRGVVSFSSKLGKGKLAAALLERIAAGESVNSLDDVADAWLKAGGQASRPRQTRLGSGLDLLD